MATGGLGALRKNLRRYAGAFVVDNTFRGLSKLGSMLPRARPAKHGVEVLRDLPYLDDGSSDHLLDIYRPLERRPSAPPLPIVLYVHGGGFRILSKDTHWIMAIAFARKGYLVFNVNYRLAPRHRYPAALQDVCHAYEWVVKNAARFGGDATQMVFAGESAGANLVTALAVATHYERPEPWARRVFDIAGTAPPRAVLPACGMLQVSDPERFHRRRKIPGLIYDRIEEVSRAYLGNVDGAKPGSLDLADPLLVFERGDKPARPLPPFFSFAGTKDPILDDTRRLHAALAALGVTSEVKLYPGELHAFHALVWRPAARAAWTESFDFLGRVLAAERAFARVGT